MRKYVLIGAGGMLGALLRYLIKNLHVRDWFGEFPISVLVINISGSFLLGFVLTTASRIKNFDEDIKVGIASGLLGAYTTFSTFCKDIVILLENHHYIYALLYTIFSIGLGLGMAWFGTVLANIIIPKLKNSGNREMR